MLWYHDHTLGITRLDNVRINRLQKAASVPFLAFQGLKPNSFRNINGTTSRALTLVSRGKRICPD